MTTISAMIAANNPRRPKRLRRRRGRRSGRLGDVGSSSGSGVEIDNWRRELLHQAPQEREGVDASRVSALERDLQGVLSDEGDVADLELVIVQSSDPRQPPRRA